MARNVQIQVLRGTQANIQSAMPLALGEMYFATDTANLFFGTPGVGIGYIQVGDMSQMSEQLNQLIVLTECVRRALVSLACQDDKGNKEFDFDPATVSTELAGIRPTGI